MAVTIQSSPNGSLNIAAAYNPIVYTITSTNYAQKNFRFIADIYMNGGATPLPRIKYVPVPANNYQAIDVGGIIKNYVTRDPYVIGDTKFKKNSNSVCSFTIQFGEEYGPSSGVTTYANLTQTSGSCYVPNIALSYPDFVTGLSSYKYGSTSKKWLTNAPRISNVLTINNIKTTESYWLYFFNPFQSATLRHDNIFVEACDDNGATLNITAFANPYSAPTVLEETHLRVGVGCYDLGLLTTPDLLIGTAPVLPANTTYYNLYLYANSGSGITTEVVRFYVTNKCSKATTTYRLVWLDTLGGYDSFTFYGQSQRTSSVDRKTYKKYAGYFNSSNVFTFDNQNSRQNAQYNTVVKDSFKVNSDWITEAESTWLEELITSPDVYYVSGTQLMPIQITDSSYTFKTLSRDNIFNLEVTFAPTYERMRQQF